MRKATGYGIAILVMLFVFAASQNCYALGDSYRIHDNNKVANQGGKSFHKPEVTKTGDTSSNWDTSKHGVNVHTTIYYTGKGWDQVLKNSAQNFKGTDSATNILNPTSK